MTRYLPTLRQASAIERRARKLHDPIARLRYLREATAKPARRPFRKSWIGSGTLALLLLACRSDAVVRRPSIPLAPAPSPAARVATESNIWPVEQNAGYDLYSNGLRIENCLRISNKPRSYRAIARGSGQPGPLRDQPAGIVFHTSESDQAPFESEHNQVLTRIGQDLLQYVRSKRAYHFVIDRFGRVYRIVAESDAANHAGHSVWADSAYSYLELNSSFLGVAFEARMQPDQAIITEAQRRVARALTEMLRAKYDLPAENCVVHAQVSINPGNRRIGWHTDWGAGFPFREIGLPDNYRIPNPSLYLFGFEYDQAYTAATGRDLWQGLAAAEHEFREAAARRGVTPAAYRDLLYRRFLDGMSAVHHMNADEENQS